VCLAKVCLFADATKFSVLFLSVRPSHRAAEGTTQRVADRLSRNFATAFFVISENSRTFAFSPHHALGCGVATPDSSLPI
jgi:hypothetical protein